MHTLSFDHSVDDRESKLGNITSSVSLVDYPSHASMYFFSLDNEAQLDAVPQVVDSVEKLYSWIHCRSSRMLQALHSLT